MAYCFVILNVSKNAGGDSRSGRVVLRKIRYKDKFVQNTPGKGNPEHSLLNKPVFPLAKNDNFLSQK